MVVNFSGFGSFIQSLVKKLDPVGIDAAAGAVAEAALKAHKENPLPTEAVRELLKQFSQATSASSKKTASVDQKLSNLIGLYNVLSVLVVKNLNSISEEQLQIVKDNPKSLLAFEMGRNPNLTITDDLLQIVSNNPDCGLAQGIGQKPNLTITNDLLQIVKDRRYSALAFEMGRNPNLTITDDLLQMAKDKPNSRLALGIGQNPNLTITDDLLQIIKDKPDSQLTLGIGQNPNLTITDDLLQIVSNNPDSRLAQITGKHPKVLLNQFMQENEITPNQIEPGSLLDRVYKYVFNSTESQPSHN